MTQEISTKQKVRFVAIIEGYQYDDEEDDQGSPIGFAIDLGEHTKKPARSMVSKIARGAGLGEFDRDVSAYEVTILPVKSLEAFRLFCKEKREEKKKERKKEREYRSKG